MRKTFLVICIIGLILIGFLIVLGSLKFTSAITEDISYTFENDILFNGNAPFDNDSFNLRDSYEYTQNYSGTYSFLGETGLTNTDISFVDAMGKPLACTITVISNKDMHNEVLELKQYGDSDYLYIRNDFSESHESGTIELWHYLSASRYNYIVVKPTSGNDLITIADNSEQWAVHYSGSFHNIGIPCKYGIWQHIRIDFECGTGAYLGLSADTMFITINGIKKGAYSFMNVGTEAKSLQIGIMKGANTIYKYLDGIGYSWDENYDINQNIEPLKDYSNSVGQIDKIEFSKYLNGAIIPDGTDNPLGWTDLEYTTDDVNIQSYDSDPYGDKCVYINADSDNYNPSTPIGIKRNNFGIDSSSIINITIGITGLTIENDGSSDYIDIYSYDNTLICRLIYTCESSAPDDLYYYDGSSNIQLENNLFYGENFNFTFCIIDSVILVDIQWLGGYEQYIIPKIADKNGVNQIWIYTQLDNDDWFSILLLDNVGIYVNGESVIDDWFYFSIDLKTDYNGWAFYKQNLFTITAMGNFSINAVGDNQKLVNDFYIYSGNKTLNIYNSTFTTDWYTYLVCIGNSANFSITSLYIRGGIMIDSFYGYEYGLQYDYLNVNINESYFWVSNHKLYGNFTANDNNLEYMIAIFEIKNQDSRNGKLSFKSYYSYNIIPLFSIVYESAEISYYPFSCYGSTLSEILPQAKEIDSFIISITDLDEYNDTIISCWISDIKIDYSATIGYTLTIGKTMDTIIPLVVILTPSLGIYSAFKKDKRVLIPSMLVMLVICWIGNIIPFWLFLYVLIGLGILLFLMESEKD